MENEQPVVQVDAPTSEPEAEAAVEIAAEQTEQAEAFNEAVVEVERLRQEGETARCAIEAEASVQREEAYSEARIAEAEAVAETTTEQDEWRQNIEARLTALNSTLETLAAQLIPPPSMPAEQPDPTNSPEKSEADPSEAETAQEPVEPPKRVRKLRWI